MSFVSGLFSEAPRYGGAFDISHVGPFDDFVGSFDHLFPAREVLEIFDEAAKTVVLTLYPNYERIAADIKVLGYICIFLYPNLIFSRFVSASCPWWRS